MTPAGRLLPGFDPGWRRVHLVGLGGARMTALARILREAGLEVSGSDLKDSAALQPLREIGVTVGIGHRPDRVAGAAAVVASAAVPPDNVEVAAARASGLPVLSGGDALARVVAGFRTIGVSGTHGKTTTSGMCATVLSDAGLDPTWVVGSDLAGGRPGGRLGEGGLAVVEADEAYGSFLHLRPAVAVVTNVDDDHLDHYGSTEALAEAFGTFVAGATERAVVCLDDPRAAALLLPAPGAVTYGFDPRADVRAENVVHGLTSCTFDLVADGRVVRATVGVGGRHNVENALGAAAACLAIGVDHDAVAAGLAAFRGVRRRFEYRGSVAGADLFDDYAHHPTEIEATLAAARFGPWSRILAAFQPHLYSRTQALWRAFGAALAGADLVVVTDVYGAREDPVPGVTGKLVVDAACAAAPGRRVAYLPRLDEAARFLRSEIRPGDLVLSLGAGDVTTLPDRILTGT